MSVDVRDVPLTTRAGTTTLSELLHRLWLDDDAPDGLLAVQAHQEHLVHAFMVQVAAQAVVLAHGVPQSPAGWHAALGRVMPWQLLGDGSAFLQPDVAPEGAPLSGPEALWIVADAKGHDVKPRNVVGLEHWVIGLIVGQTGARYGGRGRYGASRMNSGWGISRPLYGWRPSLRWAPCFQHDLAAAIAMRDRLVVDYGYSPSGGLSVVSAAPWDAQLAVADLDPYYVDAARPVRLVEEGGVIVAHCPPTAGKRLDIPGGRTGDLWAGEMDGVLVQPVRGLRQRDLAELYAAPGFKPGAAVDPRGGSWAVGGYLVAHFTRWDGSKSLGVERWAHALDVEARRIIAAMLP